jgi:DNA (cytosine-5)-methyltransferase 1
MRLLDLFGGAGGASAGYVEAGFQVVGVDHLPMPHYPFEFHLGDALEVGAKLIASGEFDAVHASPPCQAHSPLRNMHPTSEFIDLIPQTRDLLWTCGLPWVIENVPHGPMPLVDPIILCGTHFDLKSRGRWLKRHRIFESNVPLTEPSRSCNCTRVPVSGVYGNSGGSSLRGNKFQVVDARVAMDISWMTYREMAQAIPPAYTEWIGRQLVAHIRTGAPLLVA